jgi:putative ABC transport system substrate-binding protein
MQFDQMKRREFITLLSGTAMAWPLVARAQQAAVPVVGLLSGSSTNAIPHLVTALQRGLEDNGFVEGQNLAMDQRLADGQFDRLPSMAAELVRRQVALIIAMGRRQRLTHCGSWVGQNAVMHNAAFQRYARV